MGLDNSLNLSELFKRLGLKGDSLGSAPLLESLRLTLAIGDLSDLIPPVGVPFAGAAIQNTSGVGTVNKWSLACRSPGGLTVQTLSANDSGDYNLWVSQADAFAAPGAVAAHDFAFGQSVLSIFRNHAPLAAVTPPNTFRMQAALNSQLPNEFLSWVGPAEFFNIEASSQNVSQTMAISWKEYPAALNP